jgi:hypothetical protein
MHRTLPVVAILLTIASIAMADDAKEAAGKAAYDATRDYRHHLADVLDPKPGAMDTLAEFGAAVDRLKMDSIVVETSDAMRDEKARPFVRQLLDLLTPLRTAVDAWQSQTECENAANDAQSPAATRETLRRAAARLQATRKQIVEQTAAEFDEVNDVAKARGWHW